MASKTTTHSISVLTGAVLAGSIALITPWEGVFTRTYKDIVGVDTVCIGETDKAAVAEGKRRAYTILECKDMLRARLPQYDSDFMRCVHVQIPDSVRIAGISATYNLGGGTICRSTFVRKINAGDFRGACDALLHFNKARVKGQMTFVQGLANRRHAERRVCLEGL